MIRVGYHSPFVPPEWIAAHGLEPQWLWLDRSAPAGGPPARRGQCPFAAAVAAAVCRGAAGDAVVLTTTCDQMRSTAALLEQEAAGAVFLMHVPATWQTRLARELYRDELLRLGRFLERLGGKHPSPAALGEVMQAYQSARGGLLARRDEMAACQLAEELVAVRGILVAPFTGYLAQCERSEHAPTSRQIPLALVGGPMTAGDAGLLAAIEAAGGRIALDASEGGERTLPAPFDPDLAQRDSLAALVESYFDTIVDIGRRPIAPLHDWLVREIGRRAIRGVIFRRYVSCDLWLGELHPLRQRLGVPVLDLDAGQVDQTADGRTVARIDAFLESLR